MDQRSKQDQDKSKIMSREFDGSGPPCIGSKVKTPASWYDKLIQKSPDSEARAMSNKADLLEISKKIETAGALNVNPPQGSGNNGVGGKNQCKANWPGGLNIYILKI